MPEANDTQDTWLSGPLPDDPLPRLREWFDEALSNRAIFLPDAMALATVEPDGRPMTRVVLCKELNADAGWLTFYTNQRSRKARALARNPYASVVFHWFLLTRQVRVDGPVTLLAEEEADAYFATRPPDAQLSAWASDQSEPVDSRETLMRKMEEATRRFGVSLDDPRPADVPRPKHWGGYRIWAERVELWVGRTGRLHDRAEWTRELRRDAEGYVGGPWKAQRLQP
jgi:pyridoxamine 5'-phosphate oxidase